MKKALPSAMKDPSPIQRPWRVPVRWIPLRHVLPSPQRVWREATRRRFCQAPRRAVLGDGALSIWNIADDQLPDATQMVDRYHAKQYLSNVAKALYGPTTPRASQWAARRKEELDTGRFRALLNAIRRPVPHSHEARRCLHYFRTNRERMRYPEFHAQGLCTSTGVVEAGGRLPLARASNAPVCTGPFKAPMPSSLSPAQNSVVVFKTSGSADQNAGPHHFLGVHPLRDCPGNLVLLTPPGETSAMPPATD
jgi:hypothetical protein